MRKVLWSTLFLLLSFSAFSQNFYQQSLKDLLSSTKTSKYIAVEGYYVDNSSFMVVRSSDVGIDTDVRYLVYEYKSQENLYMRNADNRAEVSVFVKKELQGDKKQRILFLNKKLSNKNQLVIDEASIMGMAIVGDMATYVQLPDQVVYSTSLLALRDYLFGKGMMPVIEQERSTL